MDLTNLATTSAAGIASSTTGYLLTFSPIFFMVIGLAATFVVMGALVGLFTGQGFGSVDPTFSDDTI